MFEDGAHSAQHSCRKWNSRLAGEEALKSVDTHGYLFGSIFDRPYLAHRVILAMVGGVWPPEQGDHINGVRDDNRETNLRVSSSSENNRNKKTPCTNTSGRIGVCWDKRQSRWVAEIWGDGKRVYLGGFIDKVDAISARAAGEKKYGYHENHGRNGQ